MAGDLNRKLPNATKLADQLNLSILQDQAPLITRRQHHLSRTNQNQLDYLMGSGCQWSQTEVDTSLQLSDHFVLKTKVTFTATHSTFNQKKPWD